MTFQDETSGLPMIFDLRIGLPAALAVLLVGAASGTARAKAPATTACATIGEPDVAQLFERWNAALKTKDPDAVTRMYAPDAILLPTVSNKLRSNSATRMTRYRARSCSIEAILVVPAHLDRRLSQRHFTIAGIICRI